MNHRHPVGSMGFHWNVYFSTFKKMLEIHRFVNCTVVLISYIFISIEAYLYFFNNK